MAACDRRPLTNDEIATALATLPGWKLAGGRLERAYRFRSFREAFGWMTMAALLAEKADHHPDWSQSYRDVTVRLVTHDPGAVTALDVELARRFEALAAPFAAGPNGS